MMNRDLPPHLRERMPLDDYPWERGRGYACVHARQVMRDATNCAQNDSAIADWLLWEVWGTA